MKESLRFGVNVYPSASHFHGNLLFSEAVELIQNFFAWYSTKSLRYDIKEVVEKRIENAVEMCHPYVMFNTNAGVIIKCDIYYVIDPEWTSTKHRIFVALSRCAEYRIYAKTFDEAVDKTFELCLRYNIQDIKDKDNRSFFKSCIREDMDTISPMATEEERKSTVSFFLLCGTVISISKRKDRSGYIIEEMWNFFPYRNGYELTAHSLAAFMLRHAVEPIWLADIMRKTEKTQYFKIGQFVVTCEIPSNTNYLNDSSEFPCDDPKRYYVE